MDTNLHALKRAIELLGSQRKVADVVGVAQPTISWTISRGQRVPAEWCIPLEVATKGEVTRHQLRPDLYPVEPSSHQAAE